MPSDWITTTEAAELSGYHPEYIRHLIREGKIKAELKGTMFWVDRKAFDSFLQKARKSKTTDKRFGPRRQ